MVEKQQILLYLVNSEGVKILLTKTKVEPEYFKKPYPLILRETFAKERELLEKEGGVIDWQVVKERFFENGVLLESKIFFYGSTICSIQKSVIIVENNSRFIYSVGISAEERLFEDYRPLAEYIIDSVYY